MFSYFHDLHIIILFFNITSSYEKNKIKSLLGIVLDVSTNFFANDQISFSESAHLI